MLQGKSSLLFTYGVTGGGKTYTMAGGPMAAGILPRTVDVLFNSIKNKADKYTFQPDNRNGFYVSTPEEAAQARRANDRNDPDYSTHIVTERQVEPRQVSGFSDHYVGSVFITFVEVYNNYIYDLLDDTREKPISRDTRTDIRNAVYVEGATEVEVESADEAIEWLARGEQRRRVSDTLLNKSSSRLTPCSPSVSCRRLSSLTSPTTRPKMLRSAINNSLLTLRLCFEKLRHNQRRRGPDQTQIVPYRDSKITLLFKQFFEGAGKVRMILCINPKPADYQENLNVLEFGEESRAIKVRADEDRLFDSGADRPPVPKRFFVRWNQEADRIDTSSQGSSIADMAQQPPEPEGDDDAQYIKRMRVWVGQRHTAHTTLLQGLKQSDLTFEAKLRSALCLLDYRNHELAEMKNQKEEDEAALARISSQLRQANREVVSLRTRLRHYEEEDAMAVDREAQRRQEDKLQRQQYKDTQRALKKVNEVIESASPTVAQLKAQFLEGTGGSKSQPGPSTSGGNRRPAARENDFVVGNGVSAFDPRFKRRSKSVPRVLMHQSNIRTPTSNILRPKLPPNAMSTAAPGSRDLRKSSEYMLTHEGLDKKGNMATSIVKGRVIPTAGGGTAVCFDDVEKATSEKDLINRTTLFISSTGHHSSVMKYGLSDEDGLVDLKSSFFDATNSNGPPIPTFYSRPHQLESHPPSSSACQEGLDLISELLQRAKVAGKKQAEKMQLQQSAVKAKADADWSTYKRKSLAEVLQEKAKVHPIRNERQENGRSTSTTFATASPVAKHPTIHGAFPSTPAFRSSVQDPFGPFTSTPIRASLLPGLDFNLTQTLNNSQSSASQTKSMTQVSANVPLHQEKQFTNSEASRHEPTSPVILTSPVEKKEVHETSTAVTCSSGPAVKLLIERPEAPKVNPQKGATNGGDKPIVLTSCNVRLPTSSPVGTTNVQIKNEHGIIYSCSRSVTPGKNSSGASNVVNASPARLDFSFGSIDNLLADSIKKQNHVALNVKNEEQLDKRADNQANKETATTPCLDSTTLGSEPERSATNSPVTPAENRDGRRSPIKPSLLDYYAKEVQYKNELDARMKTIETQLDATLRSHIKRSVQEKINITIKRQVTDEEIVNVANFFGNLAVGHSLAGAKEQSLKLSSAAEVFYMLNTACDKFLRQAEQNVHLCEVVARILVSVAMKQLPFAKIVLGRLFCTCLFLGMDREKCTGMAETVGNMEADPRKLLMDAQRALLRVFFYIHRITLEQRADVQRFQFKNVWRTLAFVINDPPVDLATPLVLNELLEICGDQLKATYGEVMSRTLSCIRHQLLDLLEEQLLASRRAGQATYLTILRNRLDELL
ncbi:unnamed protein product, partial [Mesorhabditis spiculigera]